MIYRCSNLWLMVTAVSCVVLPSIARIRKQHQPGGGDIYTNDDPISNIRHVLPVLDLENNTVTDVKVNVGDVAYLPCRFPQLSTLQQVSWIRRWDWHILTTGIYTYTSDMRFNVLHTEGSDDWTLQLKYVDTRDNGTYECQMYTENGAHSQYVNLHVSKPRATIHGPSELHVQEGDTVTLLCEIQQSKPPFVFWYHGDNMVNYEGERHRLNVATRVDGLKTHSRLTIKEARHSDSGNYSCIPPHVDSAFVIIYVTKGDTAAAVHRWGRSSATCQVPSSLHAAVISTAAFLAVLNSCFLSSR